MLTQLTIRNFALIENLTLEFQPGLTVVTGETGAGKSMLLEAIALALGSRAEQTLLRPGAARCEITLTFDVQTIPAVQQWLAKHDLVNEDECILRRTISQDNRSRCTLNGSPIPLQLARELGALLLDLHSQHEYQSLLKRDQQRDLLDEYAGHAALRQTVAKLYREWHTVQQQLSTLQISEADRLARVELVRYHLRELEAIALNEAEISALDQEQRRLAHAEQLQQNCQHALQLLEEESQPAALDLLARAQQELIKISQLDAKTHNAEQLLNEAVIAAREAASELQAYLDALEVDAERVHFVEQQVSVIQQLARKHRVAPTQLPALLAHYRNELTQLEQAGSQAAALQPQLAALANAYQQAAQQLTHSRQQAATRLAQEITAQIRTLSLPGGQFAVQLEPLAEDGFYPHGQERVEFQVSLNPGQSLQPLNQAASGGELSRISLAIQVILAQHAHLPTLIFDEVDVGIGGGTAETVGRLLRALGEKAQVLCITHLPQVAAQGHQHLTVRKEALEDTTCVQIETLDNQQRITEIARMLGGLRITKQTLAHAREMLQLAPAQTS